MTQKEINKLKGYKEKSNQKIIKKSNENTAIPKPRRKN